LQVSIATDSTEIRLDRKNKKTAKTQAMHKLNNFIALNIGCSVCSEVTPNTSETVSPTLEFVDNNIFMVSEQHRNLPKKTR
jgi:hypothetical protein